MSAKRLTRLQARALCDVIDARNATIAALRKRIKAIRARAWDFGLSKEFWDLCDLRKPLPAARRKGRK